MTAQPNPNPTLRSRPTWRASTPATRAVLLWAAAIYALGLIVIFTLITRAGFAAQSMLWLIGLNVIALPLWIALPFAIVRDRRHLRAIAESNYRHCLKCAYDLTALPTPPAPTDTPNPTDPAQTLPCPECAEPFTPENNKQAWRKALQRTSTEPPSPPPHPPPQSNE